MASNPVQYTSRTFRSILSDINSVPELADKPEWYKVIWAGVGDVISWIVNAQANDMMLRTAFTRRAHFDMAQMLDYAPTPVQTASGTILFHLEDTVSFPKTIAVEDLVASTPGGQQSSLRFEARSGVTVNQTTETFTAGTNDELTVAREYTTGEKVQVSSGGTLPAPLSAGTDYYVIKIDATTIKLATTIADAFAGNAINITSTGSGTHTIELFSTQVTCYQQRSIDQYVAGTSDGTTAFQEFPLRDQSVLRDTVQITINSVTWTRVNTLAQSSGTDQHYLLRYDSEGNASIVFGNGTFGAVPGNFDVLVSYAIGGGDDSNVPTKNRVTLYAGSDNDIDAVTNPQAMTGGNDAESDEQIKELAPLLLKARDRFVTTEDGEALARNETGAALARVNRNAFGVLSAQVLVVAPGGGNLSASDQSSLQSFLIDKTLLEEPDIRVEDITFVTVNYTASAKILPGYSYSNVEPYIRLALKLAATEVGQEIKDTYNADGISDAVDLINTALSESFGEADYTQIETLIEGLTPANFGADLNQSDAQGLVDAFVSGVDFITFSSPTFPVSVTSSEITTVGSISLSEIP